MNGKKRALILGTATLFLVCAIATRSAKGQAGGSAAAINAPSNTLGQASEHVAEPKKAEEQFKNVQTLKGIPADQLIPAMQFISASLGVECEFCHVQGAFEKDDKKPKQTARKMMEMMITINQENFDGKREVTCYSCHRGSTDPAATPVVMEEAKAGADVAKQNEFE